MRIIKVELPSQLHPRDPGVDFTSQDARNAIDQRLAATEYEISEHVRHRAAGYFPSNYSVFARTRWQKDQTGLVNEIWVVDPNVRWPQGLLTRRAWSLFVPVLAHVARETTEQRVPELSLAMNEKAATVTVLGPTRAWRDPVLVSLVVFALTSLLWLVAVPFFWGSRPAEHAVSPPRAELGSSTAPGSTAEPPVVSAVGPAWKPLDQPNATPTRSSTRSADRSRP